MNIAIGIEHFALTGGAATYTFVLAQHLQRIGHDIEIVTPDAGEMAERARAAGIVVSAPDEAHPPDVVVAQDAMISLALAALFPGVPQLFVAHGAEIDNAMPPQLDGVVVAALAMNDRVANRLHGLATEIEVVRLRQPLDWSHFRARRPPADRARRVLMFGNYLRGGRREAVLRACDRLGLECVQVGRFAGNETTSPATAISDADIVIGYGRAVLEAMSSERAAYIYEQHSADGWVTAERYPALERNGFAGTAFEDVIDEERLTADLAAYHPGLGTAGRALILRHHGAHRHAAEVAAILKRLGPVEAAPTDVARDVARLTRDKWHSDWRVIQISHELEAAEERARAAEERAHRAEAQLGGVMASRRYRFAVALARPLERIREWRDR